MKWSNAADENNGRVLVSHTGRRLVRPVAFRFTLNPTAVMEQHLLRCAGAARFAFNHHLGAVKTNLTCRTHQRAFGMPADEMTPSLSWAAQSRISEFNAWKNGRLHNSPVDDSGTRGLAWRAEIPADLFECASVDAARALGNFSASTKRTRAGAQVGFPKFKSRHRATPSFRLRSKSKPGAIAPVRFTDAKHLRLGKLGEVRVSGNTRQVRRMLKRGTFHIYSVTVTRRAGRWAASVSGVAAAHHHQHPRRTGSKPGASVEFGFSSKALAVARDTDGFEVRMWKEVTALRNAQRRLKAADQALARTKPGSRGRAAASSRRRKREHQAAVVRRHLAHEITTWLVSNCDRIVIDDVKLQHSGGLNHAFGSAGLRDLRWQLEYKSAWYGTELAVPRAHSAGVKVCSGCGELHSRLPTTGAVYRCELCGKESDTAENVARWERPASTGPPPPPVTA